jgi:hypothetical protein
MPNMMAFHRHVFTLAVVCALHVSARDMRETGELLAKGRTLSAENAAKLEQKLSGSPRNEEARIQLLSYYATPGNAMDVAKRKAMRAKHIHWMIESDPVETLGLSQIWSAVTRLNCSGDEFADRSAAERASELWLTQLQKHRGNEAVRRQSVDSLQFCQPEKAEQILKESQDRAGLGRLYATALLGVTGHSYLNSEPPGTDAALRQSPFAEHAQKVLNEEVDKEVLVAAATTLLRTGANLWADGKLDWDYTSLGNNLLAKAKALVPEDLSLITLPTGLPARGERPPMTIRVGGNVMQSKLVKQPAPKYPPNARDLGIQGTVRMAALVGLDGRILGLHVQSGPPELVPASIAAVRQWEYQPITLNSKPCYIMTLIDVNFVLSAQ